MLHHGWAEVVVDASGQARQAALHSAARPALCTRGRVKESAKAGLFIVGEATGQTDLVSQQLVAGHIRAQHRQWIVADA